MLRENKNLDCCCKKCKGRARICLMGWETGQRPTFTICSDAACECHKQYVQENKSGACQNQSHKTCALSSCECDCHQTKSMQTASLRERIISEVQDEFRESIVKALPKDEESVMVLVGCAAFSTFNRIREEIRKGWPDEAFIDYPDTPDGRKSKHENRLYNSGLKESGNVDKVLGE